MANLAIKGHETRGREIIELLEMLGGKNKQEVGAIRKTCIYFIDGNTINLLKINQVLPGQFIVFTLEEFLEKYPYKVGDKVSSKYLKNFTVGDKVSSKYLKNFTIEKMEWKDTENRVIYKLQGMGRYSADELQPYKKETMEERENFAIFNIEHKQLKVHSLKFDKTQLVINDEYELSREGDTYYIVRKKPQYPKTYKECCEVLGLDTMDNDAKGYKHELIIRFQELIIARNAYWKIAGEQMGLGKPWEPDWNNLSTSHEFIKIDKGCFTYSSMLLVFPTEEMRNVFYENFKNEIEQCKEFL